MTLPHSLLRLALVVAALLLIPLVAMQFTQEVTWTALDFATVGGLLFGAGSLYLLIARQGGNRTYRLAVAVAVLAGLLLIWANLAVGLIGSEHNPANLLFGAAPLVALLGAVATRFQPQGMARAMFATAATYAVVTTLALLVWPPAAAVAEPSVNLPNVLVANGVLASLWLLAGWLFGRAAAGRSQAGQLAA